jgi:hypothetical protein
MTEQPAKPKVITYSETDTDKSFSESYFLDRHNYMAHLANLKQSGLESSDSWKGYLALDPSAASRDKKYALENLEDMVGGEAKRLAGFSRKNFKDLASLVSEDDAIMLALKSAGVIQKGTADTNPEEEKTRKEKEDKYNQVAQSINTFHETTRRIKEEPDKYFAEQLKKHKIDEKSQYGIFLKSRKERVLEADQRILQMRAARLVKNFKAGNYLAQNLSLAVKYEKPTDEETADNKKLQDLAMAIDVATDEKSKLAAMKAFEEESKKLDEKYKMHSYARNVISTLTGPEMWANAVEGIERKKTAKKS